MDAIRRKQAGSSVKCEVQDTVEEEKFYKQLCETLLFSKFMSV